MLYPSSSSWTWRTPSTFPSSYLLSSLGVRVLFLCDLLRPLACRCCHGQLWLCVRASYRLSFEYLANKVATDAVKWWEKATLCFEVESPTEDAFSLGWLTWRRRCDDCGTKRRTCRHTCPARLVNSWQHSLVMGYCHFETRISIRYCRWKTNDDCGVYLFL